LAQAARAVDGRADAAAPAPLHAKIADSSAPGTG
jgi:hypothetical protein